MGEFATPVISATTVIYHVKIITIVTLAVAALSLADDEIIDASEFVGVEPTIVQVPSRFQQTHPETAAKIMDVALFDGSELTQSTSAEKVYQDAQQRRQSLLQDGKGTDECIKSAETTIQAVLHEFKTVQIMINKMDDGCKCSKKGEYEVKRAAARWRKARKEVITTTQEREETNKDSCKKEVTTKQVEKARMKEYLQAKEFAVELQRQCKCAVINNEHKLVQFSQTMIRVRAKTVVRETILICIVKAESKKKSTKACKSKEFIKSLETETIKKLTIKKKKLCPGVAKTLCGEKEKDVKEKKHKEEPQKEKQSKEGKVKEKKAKSKELTDKERRAKEVANKKEQNSKEAKNKESSIKEREGKERKRKEKSTKEGTKKEKASKEGKIKEKKGKERTKKIELTKKEKTNKEKKRKELELKEGKVKEERSKKEKKGKEQRTK